MKRTAKTVDQVRAWMESTQHHIAEVIGGSYEQGREKPPTHLVLKGHHDQLRIPVAILEHCYYKASDSFDNRMYRWDFEKEKAILFGEYVEPRNRMQVKPDDGSEDGGDWMNGD